MPDDRARHHHFGRLLLLVLVVLWGLPAPVAAVEPPPELNFVCIDAQDDVIYAEDATRCTSRETLRTLPDDRPAHWCADHLGKLKESTQADGCSPRAQSVTIPDAGPIFVCAENVKGGSTLPRGDLRMVVDISDCDPHETGLVTPAAPEGAADVYSVDEDTELVVPAKGLLANDRDITGEPLTAHLVSGPPRGNLALAPDGGFAFDPRGVFDDLDAGETASTSFTYFADDGALASQPTAVTIRVTGRNDRPVAAGDVIRTDEDTALQLSAPGVLGNDTDAEGHPLDPELLQDVPRGSLDLEPDGSLRFDPGTDFQHLGASLGDIGTTTFTYVARDSSTASDEATVTVEVLGINDAPVGAADEFSTDENTPLDISPDQLLGNDTDPEAQSLTVTHVDSPTMGSGTFSRLADGTVRFNPNADSADPDSDSDFDHLTSGQTARVELTYRADDGALSSGPVTVSIVVHGASAPSAHDDTASADEDHAVAIDLLANDRARGGELTVDSSDTQGMVAFEGDGVVRYDPRGAFEHLPTGDHGADSFDYTLTNDEGSSTGTVTVDVSGVNDAPVANDDSYRVKPGEVLEVPSSSVHDPAVCATMPCDVLANDPDVDTPHGEVVAQLVSPPDHGRLFLEPDGGFRFDPSGQLDGAVAETSFTYRATDGEDESATASVTFQIDSNVAPDFEPDSYAFVVPVSAVPGDVVGKVSATDPDREPVSFAIIDGSTTAFDLEVHAGYGAVTVGTDGPPAVGDYSLIIEANDGKGGRDTATVTVSVVPQLNAVDDAFTAVGNTELVGGEPPAGAASEVAVVHVGSLLANDGGGNGRVVAQDDLPTARGGSVDIFTDGSFVYTPPAVTASGWDGSGPLSDTFPYTLDGDEADTSDDPDGLVAINVLEPVWYVDSGSAGPSGTGTAIDPFTTLAQVSGDPNDLDRTGQTLFLVGHPDDPGTAADESAYQGGVVLEDRQRLVGHGAGLTVNGPEGGIVVAVRGATPRVNGGGDTPAVTLATGNDLRGFAVGGTGPGLVGGSVGGLSADLPEIVTAGDPLSLTGGTVNVAVGELRDMGQDPSLLLDRVGGVSSLRLVDVSVEAGVTISDASATLFGDRTLEIGAAVLGDRTLRITGNQRKISVGEVQARAASTALSITANRGRVHLGELTGSAVDAVAVNDNDGTVAIDRIDIVVSDDGLSIADHDGQITIADGVISGDSESLLGALLEVSGEATTTGTTLVGADLLLEPSDGLLTSHTGRSVHIDGLDGGSVAVTGKLVDRGLGVQITDSAGTVRFSGGMDVLTGASPALHAQGLEVLEVPVTTQDVLLTSGAATTLVLGDVGIGPQGAQFDRVDSSGATLDPSGPYTTGVGVDLRGVRPVGAGPEQAGLGLTVIRGSITSPDVAGVRVADSSGVNLRALVVDRSGGDGVVVTRSNAVALHGLTVRQPNGTGIDAGGSGDLLIDGAVISSAGQNGVRLVDLQGRTTLSGSRIDGSRGTQLWVADDEATGGAQDSVVLESTVVNGAEPEDDSIVVSATDDSSTATAPADLEFRVIGEAPSGSIGGNIGLNARATAGARLHVGLTRFAVADTAGDAVRFTSLGSGTALTFDLASMDSSGGGGIQLAGGAGIRAIGDGTATLGGSLSEIQVLSTGDSGIVLDQVRGVTMDVVKVQATEEHGIRVTGSTDVHMDQVEVIRPAQHGLYLFDGTNVVVDNSRFDLRPPPAATDDAETYPNFSAIWLRHLGGTQNAVTDTTLRGSTSDQLMVLQGALDDPAEPTAPPGVATAARIQISGLTAIETALDPDPDDDISTDGDAVTVLAGEGADLTVDLGGNASTIDAPVTMRSESGGNLRVQGGHAISHSGRGDSVSLVATGAGSRLRLALDGLAVTQLAPLDGATTTPAPGSALSVAAMLGAVVAPDVVDAPAATNTTVRSLGYAHAVRVLADEPGSDVTLPTTGLDVAFTVPSGVASTADAVSVTAMDESTVSVFNLRDGTVAAHGGEAISIRTVGTDLPDPAPLAATRPVGTVSSVTIDGATVTGGDGDAVEVSGRVEALTMLATTVTGSGANGVHVHEIEGTIHAHLREVTVTGSARNGIELRGPGCVDLIDNDTTGAGGIGYVLSNVNLVNWSEPVDEWLRAKGNAGPPDPNFASATVTGGCAS